MSDENLPAGVGPVLGAHGACPAIDYAGKTWSVSWPTQRAKAELEILVAATAFANLEQLASVLPPERYKAKCAELDAQIYAGQHRSWGALWSAVNSGPDGTPLFLLSLLKIKHPEATITDARKMWRDVNRQVNLALAQVIPGFFTILADDLPVPPEQRGALMRASIEDFLGRLTQPTFTADAITA